MIIFTPLSVPFSSISASTSSTTNSNSDSLTELEKTSAYAYLLEIDDVKILVDCGAPEDFTFPDTENQIETEMEVDGESKVDAVDQQNQPVRDQRPLDQILKELAPSIDLVLLSHSTLSHLGLYSYARSRLGLTCPVYSTLPVQAMGRLTVLEAIEGWRSELDVEKFNKNPPSSSSSLPTTTTSKEVTDSLTITQPDGTVTVVSQEKEQELMQEAAKIAGEKVVDGIMEQERLEGESKDLKEEIKKDRCIPTEEEVDDSFDEINTLRYLQPTHLDGKCAGLTLTAYSAGHSLGGAIWKIRSPTSGTILIALSWNHMRERHLDGTALLASPGASSSGQGGTSASQSQSTGGILDAVRRSDLLICDVERGGMAKNARRKDKDKALIDLVHKTVTSNNSILFPVDPSARLLELLVLLDQHWAYAYPNNKSVSLCLISRTGKEVIERARTFMEWMTREWARGNEDGKKRANQISSPLDFKSLRIFTSIAAMDEALDPSSPKAILAVPLSLSHGPSRKLLSSFVQNPNNVVILTQRGDPDSLSRRLWDLWESKQATGKKWGDGEVGSSVECDENFEIKVHNRVALSGEELDSYRSAQEEARQLVRDEATKARAMQARSRRRIEADEGDESDSDSDSEDEDGTGNGGAGALGEFAEPGGSMMRKRKHQVAFDEEEVGQSNANQLSDKNVSFDIYLKGNASRATSFFGKSGGLGNQHGAGSRFRMFPFFERKKRIDAFGEVIDVSRWKAKRGEMDADGDGVEGNRSGAGIDANAIPLNTSNPFLSLQDQEQEKRRGERQQRKLQTPPSKFVQENIQLTMSCQLFFVDMSGLNDGRALKTLIPQLHPRRLIAVNGNENTRREMLSTLSSIRSMTRDMNFPVLGEIIKIGQITSSFTVNLSDGILAGLKLSKYEDFEVAQIRGMLKENEEEKDSVPMLEVARRKFNDVNTTSSSTVQMAEGSQEDQAGSTSREDSIDNKPSLPPTIFIGDLKLSNLKSVLASRHRVLSEFAGEGMLVCGTGSGTNQVKDGSGASVTVQKESKGRVVIEGNVARGFYKVRDAVYGLHAKV